MELWPQTSASTTVHECPEEPGTDDEAEARAGQGAAEAGGEGRPLLVSYSCVLRRYAG